MKTPTIEDIIYMASFIDGEGCICVMTRKRPENRAGVSYMPYVSIVNTDEGVIKSLANTFEYSGTGLKKVNKEKHMKRWGFKTLKDVFMINFKEETAIELLKLVRPFLRIKGAQADKMFELDALRSNRGNYIKEEVLQKQFEIYKQVRRMNNTYLTDEELEAKRPKLREAVQTVKSRENPRICKFEGCTRKRETKDWCPFHLQRFQSKFSGNMLQNNCATCGKDITSRQLHAKYCSHSCNMKNYRKRKKDKELLKSVGA